MPRRSNEMTNFGSVRALVENNGKEFGEKTAVLWQELSCDDEYHYISTSYEGFYEDFKYLSLAFKSMGFDKNTKVALLGINSYPLMLSLITLVGGSGIPAAINHRESEDIIEHCFTSLDAKHVIADRTFEKLIPSGMQVIYTDEIIGLVANAKESYPDAELPESNVDPDNDTSLIIFTAGSTGLPKQVKYTNTKIYRNVNTIRKEIILLNRNRFLSVMPLATYYELFFGLFLPFSRGAEIIYSKKDLCDIENVKNPAIKALSPTILVLSPSKVNSVYTMIWNNIVDTDSVDDANKYIERVNNTGLLRTGLKQRCRFSEGLPFGNKIKFIISAGDILTNRAYTGLRAFGIPVINVFGYAECPMTALKSPLKKVDNEKQLFPCGIEYKTERFENELCGKFFIRGERLASGNPDEWFDTDEFATVDEYNVVQIYGKSTNMLKIKGTDRFLFPEQMERIISSEYGITDTLIFPKKTEEGYVIAARVHPEDAVTTNRGKEGSAELVISTIKRINKRLLPFKRIRALEISYTTLSRRADCKLKREKYDSAIEVIPVGEAEEALTDIVLL